MLLPHLIVFLVKLQQNAHEIVQASSFRFKAEFSSDALLGQGAGDVFLVHVYVPC